MWETDSPRDSYRGEGEGGLPPPPPPPPPLLNQHKYYSKVVLKHKQQQSDNCCSKKVCSCSVQKHLEFFPKSYSSCQSIHCFLVGAWGASDDFPPFSKNPV